jgi:L-alanine-DL-glutamate epimerase-like enolase superfamily enzyme
MSAVDIALWDLRARRQAAPLWRVLGGFDPRVPCYAGGIDLDFPLDALLRQTDENLARGFRAIKMKVGRPSLQDDVGRVRAMRRHLGPEFPLMVDANMRWSVDEAIRAARALAELAPVWLEEPTIPDDVPGHVRIVREGGLPIAAGENLHTLYEFRQLIAAGGVTFPEPDVTNCGGVTAFLKICHLAESFNLPVTSHGAHDLTVTCSRRRRTARTWRLTASVWTASSPSRCGSSRASPSHPTARATASNSTGRRSTRSGQAES